MFSLEPWTLFGITHSSQKQESAVSLLIHVIHIHQFHKLVEGVMSATFMHVTVTRKLHRGFFLCSVTADSNLSAAIITLFFKSVKGYVGPCVTCYVTLLLISHYSPQHAGNPDPFACEDKKATAMCSRAWILGEQHFHKVYLGCHIQGQGLLTDMISLAGLKGTHYPQTVWSNFCSFQTALFIWCLAWITMIVSKMHSSLSKKKKEKEDQMWTVEANRWRQVGRTVAAESDDITPKGGLWVKTC